MAHIAELDDRIAKCNKILDENPNSQIFAALAEAYRKKGEVDKAFRTCQNGLRIHPGYAAAHVVMARINLDKGLYDWAEIEVQKASEIEGNSHSTDLLLAEIYLYKGEFARATRILNKLHAADPNNQQVVKLLEIARKLPLESPIRKDPEPRPAEPARGGGMASVENKSSAKITLKQFLDAMAAIPGVEGVLLTNPEGLVGDSRWEDSCAPELFGAVVRDIEAMIQAQVEIVKFGRYDRVLLEAGNMIVNFLPLKGNLLLIKANRQINLGTLRLKMSALLGRLDEDTI